MGHSQGQGACMSNAGIPMTPPVSFYLRSHHRLARTEERVKGNIQTPI